jgi:hypothetical protein
LLAAIDRTVDELPEDPLDQPIARPTAAAGGREKRQKKTPEPTNLVDDSTVEELPEDPLDRSLAPATITHC